MRVRFVCFALAWAGAVAACTTDPPSAGGIFGDRPVTPAEEDDAAIGDAGTDARPRDAGTDRETSAPADAGDDA